VSQYVDDEMKLIGAIRNSMLYSEGDKCFRMGMVE